MNGGVWVSRTPVLVCATSKCLGGRFAYDREVKIGFSRGEILSGFVWIDFGGGYVCGALGGLLMEWSIEWVSIEG